jgi:hypothetical protein
MHQLDEIERKIEAWRFGELKEKDEQVMGFAMSKVFYGELMLIF